MKKKEESITVRVEEGTKELLQKIADSLDRDLSDYLRVVFKEEIRHYKEEGVLDGTV